MSSDESDASTATAHPLVIGHRGAPGYRPEHTTESFDLAIALGADSVEPDLVMTRDGALVIRHESDLGRTTDVAARPEFAARRSTRVVGGRATTGWFVEDFTLDEVTTLGAVERYPAVRPGSARHDGCSTVATFDQLLLLVAAHFRATGRHIGVHAELKGSAASAAHGLPLEPAVLSLLRDHGLDHRASLVRLQSFEPSALRWLRDRTDLELVQLVAEPAVARGRRTAATDPMYQLGVPGGRSLRGVATYADTVGLAKQQLLDADGTRSMRLVDDAHRAGLAVLAYTVRNENRWLSPRHRKGSRPGYCGDVVGETLELLDLEVDGLFSDQPDVTVRTLDRWRTARGERPGAARRTTAAVAG